MEQCPEARWPRGRSGVVRPAAGRLHLITVQDDTPGAVEGPIVGAVEFFLLQEWLADLGALYLVILEIVAEVIVLVAPRGL